MMHTQLTTLAKIDFISRWIGDYLKDNSLKSLIIGVSGGIDSAVVSTLCAMTGVPTFVVSMPIRQISTQHDLSLTQCWWLKGRYPNVTHINKDLTDIFEKFEDTFEAETDDLAFANTRARLRMTALYQIAQFNKGLVVGTGNKVEDFGAGFFTKYGDGGVDISPIADCMKSEVWDMGKELGINQAIIDAEPTDGLWEDGRVDTDQLGMTYAQLEEAMKWGTGSKHYEQYVKLRTANVHKMNPIPICYL
jgi:NAD+ synthase